MTSSLHALLLLSDSALPLGAFAFSSGLESYIAHRKHTLTTSASPTKAPSLADLESFLHLSLANTASTLLPYMLAAYRAPQTLGELDDELDASTPCTVARRASTVQGRALLTLWERALGSAVPAQQQQQHDEEGVPSSNGETKPTTPAAVTALTSFATALKAPVSQEVRGDPLAVHPTAHFAPLFGAVTRALSVPEREAAYLFLLNHAKAVLSAAVRAGVMGPYQSHAVLAGARLREGIGCCVEREWGTETGDVGVTVPVMDLWVGRHEVLYSRIFNS